MYNRTYSVLLGWTSGGAVGKEATSDTQIELAMLADGDTEVAGF